MLKLFWLKARFGPGGVKPDLGKARFGPFDRPTHRRHTDRSGTHTDRSGSERRLAAQEGNAASAASLPPGPTTAVGREGGQDRASRRFAVLSKTFIKNGTGYKAIKSPSLPLKK